MPHQKKNHNASDAPYCAASTTCKKSPSRKKIEFNFFPHFPSQFWISYSELEKNFWKLSTKVLYLKILDLFFSYQVFKNSSSTYYENKVHTVGTGKVRPASIWCVLSWCMQKNGPVKGLHSAPKIIKNCKKIREITFRKKKSVKKCNLTGKHTVCLKG